MYYLFMGECILLFYSWEKVSIAIFCYNHNIITPKEDAGQGIQSDVLQYRTN